MSKALEIASWKKASPQDVLGFYAQKRGQKKRKPGGMLIVRSQLRPVDIYSYLRARFGKPNGFQNFLRHNDSDNWIHWDFNLKAEDIDIYIAGTSRDIHFMISEKLSDQQWKDLIVGLKADFGRLGRSKSEMIRSFEKFVVFQNKFKTLANLCAEMHEAIVDTPAVQPKLPKITSKRSLKRYTSELDRLSKRATNLYGDCLKLRLLTPIMAEAFINMVILALCKHEVRENRRSFDAFVRLTIPERLAALSDYCDGFNGPVNQTTEAYRAFKRVMDKRNFALHGNIDPVREQIETVYFEGTRPIFSDSGDNLLKFFEHLELINSPPEVIAEYEAVHLFLFEILDNLTAHHRALFSQVINDSYPGYELHKKRVTKILPDHNMCGITYPTKYDDELDVVW